jgi:aspartyl-tRNA(Asn)/glutamyl-tRNA(Gln) amidotransferase subunit B
MEQMTNAGVLDLVAATVAEGASADDARGWWLGYLVGQANERGIEPADLAITAAQVARVAGLVATGTLTAALARQVVEGVLAGEGEPERVIEARGLRVVSDTGALDAAIDEAIAAQPDVAEKIRAGNAKAVGPLVGAVMKATKGQADAARVSRMILERLSGS